MRYRAFLLGGAALGCACTATPRADQAAAALPPDTVTIVGTVRVVGSDPVTRLVLVTGDDEQTALEGPLRSELHETVGLEVRVTGIAANPAPPARRAVNVQAYEPLSLEGTPVYTGVLSRSGDELHLVTPTARWTLRGGTDELLRAEGAKVWIAGTISDETLNVSAYGIIKQES